MATYQNKFNLKRPDLVKLRSCLNMFKRMGEAREPLSRNLLDSRRLAFQRPKDVRDEPGRKRVTWHAVLR